MTDGFCLLPYSVIVIAMTMCTVLSPWYCHCGSSPGSFGKCSASAWQSLTFVPSQSVWASDPPKLAAVVLHSPSSFITTQPESWNSFYHPMEGRRLSWPDWLRTGMVYCQQTVTRPSSNWARRRVTLLWHKHYVIPPTMWRVLLICSFMLICCSNAEKKSGLKSKNPQSRSV